MGADRCLDKWPSGGAYADLVGHERVTKLVTKSQKVVTKCENGEERARKTLGMSYRAHR